MIKNKYTYESIKEAPTEELVDVLCEAQNEKWAAETVIGFILAELVDRRNKKNDKEN
jgi:hypothetical protein